ncbi:OprO/OprP family phosphate-selective porin [Acetobacter ghanensis]|uniref:OprO/OprP family phosphate-selective porin n=1 Tax=Acetobacter ghanensis TaxID=431306 RepID=UPI003D34A492
MAVSVRASVLLTTTVSSLFFPFMANAASSDAENAALRREIAEMHREMMGEIRRLQARVDKYEHVAIQQNHKVLRPHHTLTAGGADEPQPVFREDPVVAVNHGPRSASDSRIALPEGPVQSWSSFKAATAKDENVDIGGIKIGFPKGRPTIASDDKAYAFSIGLLAQEDFGGFMGVGQRGNEAAGNFNKFTQNARRLRLYLSWRYKDWVVNVTPDFGNSNNDGAVGLFEANLNYTGLHNTTLTIGYFQPRMEEESAERSGAFEFLERPTIVDLVRNIAGGVARFSIGGEHYEKRWLVSGYFTGQKFGDRNTDSSIVDSQTGAVFRATGRPYVSKDIDVHVGVGATTAFKVNESSKGRQYTFSDNMEIPLGETKLLTSGALTNIAQIWAAGPQLAFRYKSFLLKGEYYHIGVQHDNVASSINAPSIGFDGWYVAANYTLLGHARAYNEKIGAFTTPGVEYDFDPSKGHWGALEISGRWSVTDLRTSGTTTMASTGIKENGETGDKQTVWQGGVNWYPNQHIKVMLDYAHFSVSSYNGMSADLLGRSGNAVVGRVQAAF